MIDSRATRMLAFATGDYDITFPSDVSVPLMKDVKARAPHAICEMTTTGTQINLMVNRVNPPFDNPDIRKAMSLALDRKPFNTILMEGLARMGGAMLAARGRVACRRKWSRRCLRGPDTEKNIAVARRHHAKPVTDAAAADQDPDKEFADPFWICADPTDQLKDSIHERNRHFSTRCADFTRYLAKEG